MKTEERNERIANQLDGKRGWVVTAACFMAAFLTDGIFFCFGLVVFEMIRYAPPVFASCLEVLLATNCGSTVHFVQHFGLLRNSLWIVFVREKEADFQLPLHLRVLQWTCSDECKYFCMWPTVKWFVDAGIGVQQFYGKWPFIRVLGIQEPAAALFSILNLACHLVMIQKFRREVKPTTPFYLITHVFCFLCCQAWFWSTVFHIRDVRFTEIMDYLGAFSMVLFSVYHFFVRVTALSPYRSVYSWGCGIAIGFYFVYHSYTTFFVKMDYGYNMIINIAFGAVNILGWSVWCYKYYKIRPYVKRCATFIALVGFTTSLEVLDFPPLFWTFDAHALWHLSTSPLVILWYKSEGLGVDSLVKFGLDRISTSLRHDGTVLILWLEKDFDLLIECFDLRHSGIFQDIESSCW
uniref:Post-GPI attachment to proteins factor 3 n=1 Tax=Ceriodaphnia reticulata TaxID=302197 RepID=A0A4Y7LXE6_9CRUS|nr:EOG090X0702 [Ceriodaphnia reticulata]